MKAGAYTQGYRQGQADAVEAVPTTWLDSILTGPDKVIAAPPYTGPHIEAILRAVRARIVALQPPTRRRAEKVSI
jgi:hypothetical protein